MVSYINMKDSVNGIRYLNSNIDVNKLLVVAIIEVGLLLLIQLIWGQIEVKEIVISIGIVILGYFIPLAYRWYIKTEEIIKTLKIQLAEERYLNLYRIQRELNCGLILDVRYIMLVILSVLICFFIINEFIQITKINKKTIRFIINIICISVCLMLSYTYLEVQKERKERKDKIDVGLTRTIDGLESLRLSGTSEYRSQIKWMANNLLDTAIIENTKTNIGEVQHQFINVLLEVEKDNSFFEDYTKVEELRMKFGLISRSYIEFTINERLKNYLGIYIPADFEEKYYEWFSKQIKLITDYEVYY